MASTRRFRPQKTSSGRGAQGGLHLVVIAALVVAPAQLRAAGAAADTDMTASQDVQSLYESCLRQLDEGAAAAAASCLEDVYFGLVNIDKIARTDLYYVLADAVGASQQAAESDPQALCLARRLIDDWTERERSVPKLRLRPKVKKLNAAVKEAMAAAGVKSEGCVARRSEAAPVGRETQAPLEVTAPTAGTEVPTEVPTEGTQVPTETPKEATPVKPAAPRPTAVKPAAPRTMRKLGLTAKTDLLDAGFATTLASIGVAGLGGAMWAAKIECDAREGQEMGSCPSPVPQGVRDAGLALMSIGAAGVIVGLSLRWADQRRQRKLRQAPLPSVGPTSVGIGWRGQF